MALTHKIDTPHPHILILEKNNEGNDYVIGDVHGGLSALKRVLAKLKSKDRLFIVGDLMDRGEDSKGVIELVMQHEPRISSHKKPAIYVTRGNHEDMFIDATMFICNKLSCFKDIMLSLSKFRRSIINGGEWVFKETNLRNNFKKLGEAYLKADAMLDKDTREIALKQVKEEFDQAAFEVQENDAWENLSDLADYVATLPYIICVGEPKELGTFNICHTHMPMSDEALESRVQNKNLSLTSDEIEYITWARSDKFKERRPDSILTFVGHSIVFLPENKQYIIDNTVNLDVSAYYENGFFLVNASEFKIEWTGLKPLEYIKNLKMLGIQTHLVVNNPYLRLRTAAAWKDCFFSLIIQYSSSNDIKKQYSKLFQKYARHIPEAIKQQLKLFLSDIEDGDEILPVPKPKQEKEHLSLFFRESSTEVLTIIKEVKILNGNDTKEDKESRKSSRKEASFELNRFKG